METSCSTSRGGVAAGGLMPALGIGRIGSVSQVTTTCAEADGRMLSKNY